MHNNNIVVTSGQQFTDIDALSCVIAYADLLNLNGFKAQAVLPGTLNNSITKTIKEWGLNFNNKPDLTNPEFVLMDISNKKEFANFVSEKNISELFDHRYGYENYWKDKLGNNSHIEMVGACATLIWEEFVNYGKEKQINPISANLLYTAIASNTLNFKSTVTTKRDEEAFNNLEKYINLPQYWIKTYFSEQDSEKLNDIYGSIINDTKVMDGPVIGQLEMWNSKPLFDEHISEIKLAMESFGRKEWFLTSPSISEGRNYLFAKSKNIKELLTDKISAKFAGDIGFTEKLLLRKEIAVKLKAKS